MDFLLNLLDRESRHRIRARRAWRRELRAWRRSIGGAA